MRAPAPLDRRRDRAGDLEVVHQRYLSAESEHPAFAQHFVYIAAEREQEPTPSASAYSTRKLASTRMAGP
jgi:hypothetical protein